ncbi:MAG: hypothetical protein NTV94_19745, partial [Planctomycetota bacterium]|nr:hypothetical protein [Planctomycetota bacterium]
MPLGSLPAACQQGFWPATLIPGMSATPSTITTPSATADANTQELIPTENIEGIKGIIIAFLMALVFRAFIIEGFEIPTGSM